MKGGLRLGVVFLLAAITIVAIVQTTQKPELDWRRTFNSGDKIPYGTYVIRQELKHILPHAQRIEDLKQSLYIYYSDSGKDFISEDIDLIYIGSDFDPGEASMEALLYFWGEGKSVFISSESFSDEFMEALEFDITTFARIALTYTDTVRYTLVKNDLVATYEKEKESYVFTDLPESDVYILGYAQKMKKRFPNFVKFIDPVRGGSLYIHLAPEVFSNYYMLQEEGYALASAAIRHLEAEEVLWIDDNYSLDDIKSPLRFIISQPALRNGWYILLVALILFLLFRTRREQAAVPIVKPEENLSVAFAESIGTLYYENGNPDDMLKKKIQYFLYHLKRDFRLGDINMEDPEFRKRASHIFQLPQMEINLFFDKLAVYQQDRRFSSADLKAAHRLIEDFKQKIYKHE